MVETGIGIGFAFVAMLCWGFGDFMIQRSSRVIGDWESLFIITLFGSIVLLPFTFKGFAGLAESGSTTLIVLAVCGVLYFIGSLLDFESLRIGKITIVEPIWSSEIVVSALLAFAIISERLNINQIILIGLLIIGLLMVSIKDYRFVRLHKLLLERGTIMAFIAAMVMGLVNFMIGWGSRMSDPIFVNFVINVIVTMGCGIYLLYKGGLGKLFRDIKANPKMLLAMSVSDNAAWVAFAFSMSLAPIGVAVALSESYIIIAVILGFIVGKEKIKTHQKIGLVIACITAVILAAITSS